MPECGKILDGKVRLEWKIWDIKKLLIESRRDYICSPTFWYGGTKWYLVVRVRNITDPRWWKHGEVYVARTVNSHPESVDVTLGFLTLKGREKKVCNKIAYFGKNIFSFGPIISNADLVSMSKPFGLMTIFCHMKNDLVEEQDQSDDSSDEEEELKTLKKQSCDALRQHMKDLLASGEDHDVTITVKGLEYFAHKSILSARSPVLHEILQNEEMSMQLEDFQPDVFQTFLEFLYCGEIDNLSMDNVCQLYREADLYDVSDLKKICLTFLEDSLNVDTLCDILYFASQYNENWLLTKGLKLLLDKHFEVLDSPKWMEFLMEDPTLVNEWIKMMAMHR